MVIFSKLGEFEACGIFSTGHIVLLCLTIVGIILALKFSIHKNKKEVRNIIKNCTIFLWILEIIKIIFNVVTGNSNNPNTYIPLYFCSLILYTGLLSGYSKGKMKRVGDVFLATGGIIAGIVFVLVPMTSLTNYPAFHYISIQSFILHGVMIYIGLLINITHYIEYDEKDIKYYFSLIVFLGVLAYCVNLKLDTNLMFVSKNYPGTPIEIIYEMTGKLFPIIMIIVQATLPFYIVNSIKNKLLKTEEILVEDRAIVR